MLGHLNPSLCTSELPPSEVEVGLQPKPMSLRLPVTCGKYACSQRTTPRTPILQRCPTRRTPLEVREAEDVPFRMVSQLNYSRTLAGTNIFVPTLEEG